MFDIDWRFFQDGVYLLVFHFKFEANHYNLFYRKNLQFFRIRPFELLNANTFCEYSNLPPMKRG